MSVCSLVVASGVMFVGELGLPHTWLLLWQSCVLGCTGFKKQHEAQEAWVRLNVPMHVEPLNQE